MAELDQLEQELLDEAVLDHLIRTPRAGYLRAQVQVFSEWGISF